jgi:hypothetical protein
VMRSAKRLLLRVSRYRHDRPETERFHSNARFCVNFGWAPAYAITR